MHPARDAGRDVSCFLSPVGTDNFATLWVTLHGADHRLRVWVPTFDKRYLSHLFSIEFSVGVTRADAFAAFMRDHVLSIVWGFSHVAAICVNESLSPPTHSSLSALINLYSPTLSEVTLNSLQGLDGHLKTRGGLVKEAFKKSQTLAGTVTELVSLGQTSASVSDPDAALMLPVSDLTAAPLKGASRTAALASDEFVRSSRKLEALLAETSRDPLKICTAIFQSSRVKRSSSGGAGLPKVSLPGKGSGLMLQVAYNVPTRAALNTLTTDIVAYLHPSPLGSVGSVALSADRPHIAFYIAQVFNADPTSGAYTTHPALLASSAPSDFVHALLTLRLDTPAFDFVYLRIYFRAIRENTRAAYHTFEEYFCDEKTMRDMQRDGMKITCAMGWDPLPASGLTYWQFIQVILDSVDHMNLLQDVTMFEDRRTLIVHVYHEGLRVAAASALTFLRSIPTRGTRNFGAFLPDKDLPSLRQLLSAEEISTAQQLTIQSLTPMAQRREVSTLDHVDRSQAGVKRARISASAPAVAIGATAPAPGLTDAQAVLLGAKASLVHLSATKKTLWYGTSNDMFNCGIISQMAPGLCHSFGMTTAKGDEALKWCTLDHRFPPGVGPHLLPANIEAVRNAARSRWKPPGTASAAGATAVAPDEADAAAAPESAAPAAGRGKGKGGKGKGKAGVKAPFRQR